MKELNDITIAQISKVEKFLNRRDEISKELSENPDNVINYFKKYPYFFSTLYLRFRKYFTSSLLTSEINITDSISGTSRNNTEEFTFSIYKYFYGIDIWEDKIDDKEDYMDLFRNFIEILFKELRLIYSDYINIEYGSEYVYDDDDFEVEVLKIIIDNDFKKFFLFPIIKGEYDIEMERICKQCLLNLSLKEVN